MLTKTCSKSARAGRKLAPYMPTIAKPQRRASVLAEILAGEDAWAEAISPADLPRDTGFAFLAARAMRAVRADGWEG